MNLIDYFKRIPFSSEMSPLLLFGFIVAAGAAGGWLARRARLPFLTGNILAGLLIGPVFGVIEGEETIESMMPLSHFAMGFIAVAIGGHLSWHRIHNALRRIVAIAVCETVFTVAFVTLSIRYLFDGTWPLSLLLGILAASTAPATILHIVQESRAKGPFVKTLLSVVALDNILTIMLFAVGLALIGEYFRAGPEDYSLAGAWVLPVWLLLGSILLGLVAGYVTEHLVHRREFHSFTTVFFAILACTGLASYLGMSPLLACMFLGVFMGNRTPETEEQLDALEPIKLILFTCFFTMAGVSLHLDELARMGAMGAAFVIVRFAAKGSGAFLGGLVSGSSPRIWRNIPLGLVPQAGLAIALVILLQGNTLIPYGIRSLATSMVLAAVVVNELAGPFFTRRALRAAGEENRDRPRLMEFLQEEYIKTDLKARDKWDAIAQLCDFLISTHRIRHVDRDALLETFIARERLQSTSVGVETAITHGRIESGPSIQGVLGICPEGVDFETPDGLPVRIIMMIVTPRDHEPQHLEVLASLAAMISDEGIRTRLKTARNANEVWEIIEGEETHDYNYFLED